MKDRGVVLLVRLLLASLGLFLHGGCPKEAVTKEDPVCLAMLQCFFDSFEEIDAGLQQKTPSIDRLDGYQKLAEATDEIRAAYDPDAGRCWTSKEEAALCRVRCRCMMAELCEAAFAQDNLVCAADGSGPLSHLNTRDCCLNQDIGDEVSAIIEAHAAAEPANKPPTCANGTTTVMPTGCPMEGTDPGAGQ